MGTGPVEIAVFNQTIDAHVEETMFTSVTSGVFVAHYARIVAPICFCVFERGTSQSESEYAIVEEHEMPHQNDHQKETHKQYPACEGFLIPRLM